MTGSAVGLEKVQKARRNDDLHRAIPQAIGWLATLGEILDLHSFEAVASALPALNERYESWTGVKFSSRITKKRSEKGKP